MLIKNKCLLPLVLAILLLLEACAPTLPVVKKDAEPLPPSYPAPSDDSIVDARGGISPEITWKKFFHDKNLAILVEVALKNNQELNILQQDIAIANNEVLSRSGEPLPRVGVKAEIGNRQTETFTEKIGSDPLHFGAGGVVATWEIDIWKKLRNATKSAYFDYLASIEARRFMVTRLVAEISTGYFQLMALDNELVIINNYISILKKIRNMVQLQQSAGRTTSLAVKRFEAEVLKNQARQYKLQQQIVITENKINTLLGRYPQKLERSSIKFSTYVLSRIQPMVPSKLLDNRPDIRQASMELEANKLNVDVARARFYPSLSIDAEAGYEKFNAKHFAEPAAGFYSIAAGITSPLLNRRAIKADYFSANNKQIQAIYHYEEVMIKAYADVANQLTKIRTLNMMVDLKSKQVKALNEAFEISNLLFSSARVDYIEALMTQRDALEAQIDLIKIKKEQLTTSVDLYRSLGGGWKGLTEDFESNY